MRVWQATVEEWEDVRELRLRALRSDPDAFGAPYARDAEAPPERWAAWIAGGPERDGAVFLARDQDGTLVGIASGALDRTGPATANLYAMWVDPRARGHRLGRRLVGAVAAWARGRGATALELSVAEGNDAATALYASLGFEDTGRRHPLGEDEDRGLTCVALRRGL